LDVAQLRPIERRMTSLTASGLTLAETGQRFRRSGDYVERVLQLASLPGRAAPPVGRRTGLRPLERRLLRWRDEGADPAEVAAKFRRSPEHIARVLALADYKRHRAG
jgi:DNA-binding CsgD family transcriptional regulator